MSYMYNLRVFKSSRFVCVAVGQFISVDYSTSLLYCYLVSLVPRHCGGQLTNIAGSTSVSIFSQHSNPKVALLFLPHIIL